MKKCLLIRLLIFALALPLAIGLPLAGQADTPPDSTKAPEDYTPEPVKPFIGGSEVLVIKDVEPWFTWVHGPANEAVLKELSKTYDVITSDMLATTDLTKYDIVIIASDQYKRTYDRLISNKDKLADYVYGGGVLVAHACDHGWHSYPGWYSSWLPLGVTKVNTYQQYLSIIDPTSPIVSGTEHGGQVTDADLDRWGYSTHGYFTNLPDVHKKIIGITPNPEGQPTYIEYPYGFGTVLATMQTIEWAFSGGQRWWGLGEPQKNLLRNEIEYAQTLVVIEVSVDIKPGSFPNSINPDSKGVIPVAILTTSTEAGEPVTFDATTVDARTVRFGPDGATMVHKNAHLEDVDDDGDIDMVLHFKAKETGIKAGDTEATLTGETVEGRKIRGTDSVRTVPFQE